MYRIDLAVPILLLALAGTPATAETTPSTLPPVPDAVASFGAAVAGDHLYVYGGHVGRQHQHSIENLAHAFRRLDLAGDGGWQELGPVPGLQGLELVSHGGHLYRVGGLSARNHEEEPEDLHSVADFQRYDPASGVWEELPPLPEPRSSHGAAVLDGQLYVVGGWRLAGSGEDGEWHRTAHVIDLEAADPEWRALPEPPFTCRALAVAAVDGKVYALGGITPQGTSSALHVYDVAAESWSRGPDLPAEGRLGAFGAAAFGVAGELWATAMDGVLYRLAADGSGWLDAGGRLDTPRFFHEMVPHRESTLLFVAGASREGHLDDLETVALASLPEPQPVVRAEAEEPEGTEPSRWPGFRGRGDGHTTVAELPLCGSAEENPPAETVAWKVELPGYGQSSPVVWGDQVFLTSVAGEEKETLIVSAFDLEGQIRWRRRFPASQKIESSGYVSKAAPTAAVDADRLYVFFESGDLIALDHDGTRLWQRSLTRENGDFLGNHGVGSSLALTDGAVVVLIEHEGPSYLLSLDRLTGATRWRVDRPARVSWSSPIVSRHHDREEILVSSNGVVEAFDAATGERLWFVEGVTKNTVPSPVATDELVIAGSSQRGQTVAIRRDGRGEVTASHLLWHADSATSGFGSPLIHGDRVFLVSKAGELACVDLESGETTWEERLDDGTWASPIAAGDRVYLFAKNGAATVVDAGGETPRRVADCKIPTGDGDTVYGVAVVDRGFLVRTGTELLRIGAVADPAEGADPPPEQVAGNASADPSSEGG